MACTAPTPAHYAHHPNPQVSRPSSPAPESPRTPRDASSKRCRIIGPSQNPRSGRIFGRIHLPQTPLERQTSVRRLRLTSPSGPDWLWTSRRSRQTGQQARGLTVTPSSHLCTARSGGHLIVALQSGAAAVSPSSRSPVTGAFPPRATRRGIGGHPCFSMHQVPLRGLPAGDAHSALLSGSSRVRASAGPRRARLLSGRARRRTYGAWCAASNAVRAAAHRQRRGSRRCPGPATTCTGASSRRSTVVRHGLW